MCYSSCFVAFFKNYFIKRHYLVRKKLSYSAINHKYMSASFMTTTLARLKVPCKEIAQFDPDMIATYHRYIYWRGNLF